MCRAPTADVAAGFSNYCWHYNYNMQATAHYTPVTMSIRKSRCLTVAESQTSQVSRSPTNNNSFAERPLNSGNPACKRSSCTITPPHQSYPQQLLCRPPGTTPNNSKGKGERHSLHGCTKQAQPETCAVFWSLMSGKYACWSRVCCKLA